MSDGHKRLFPDQNPFSTAAVKPGAIAFHFDGDTSAARLVTTLQEHRWRGEIVGPHGSGKSTLLHTLLPVVEAVGHEVLYYAAKPHDQQLPMFLADQVAWTDSTLVAVEGYELLSRRHQKVLDKVCRARQAGLLITCHKPQGLPGLFQTSITIELANLLVTQLLPLDCNLITRSDVQDSFSRHGQNFREVLFEMYDLYEQRRGRELQRPRVN